MTAVERDGIRRRAEPITTGVPLPRGAVRRAEELTLSLGGDALPLQARPLDLWPDGSLRWVLLDFALDSSPRESLELTLDRDGPRGAAPRTPVHVTTSGRGLFVDTGAAQFAVDPDAFLPFRSVRTGGVERIDPHRSGWICRDAEGHEWSAEVDAIERETEGALRSSVRVAGHFARAGSARRLDFLARLHFHAGSASVRLVWTLRNPHRAAHPGGHWELGDAGSILLREHGLRIGDAGGTRVSFSPEPTVPLGEIRGASFELYQDSSGGENWRSPVHRAADGTVPVTFRGFRVRAGEEEREGLRAVPRVVVHDGTAGVSAALRRFWQEFPKGMGVEDGVLAVSLFPGRFASPHELQGGEQKTHELWLSFGTEALEPTCDFQRRPLLVRPDPEVFVASNALPWLVTRNHDHNDLYLRLVERAVEGETSWMAKRELADEYGWRHFGELWADHETRYHEGEELFVSHFNNQYDAVYGAFLQYARSGDERWFRIGEDLARHVIDIDVYHTDEDRPAYNRGLFWHTAHYVDAGLATHRSYPRGVTIGGGPANEHNYAGGFAHYHFLTGDPAAREAALERAQWVVDADDGKRTPLRWIHRGPTGLASKTREFDYHGPGRGAGNSIEVLLDAWRLTGEERWLEKVVEILRRTIHPADDPDNLNLRDAETRWSYVVHLQAVGRFLEEMVQAGRLGETYAYARESLLTYARWMAEHERPVLDEPEKLEHPTETWAAQDLRKSEVLRLAALHTRGEERARFLERAEFFFRHSLETLDSFPTKTCTRPLALLLRYGLMQSWWDHHPEETRPPPEWSGSFPPPAAFVPQKTAALRKLKRWGLAVGVALVVTVIVLLRSAG